MNDTEKKTHEAMQKKAAAKAARKAAKLAAFAAAHPELAAYWAGSASASVERSIVAGDFVVVEAGQ